MMDLFMNTTFWHWFILGGLFLVLELTLGSGFLLWLGLSALIMGFILFLVPILTLPWQILIWSLLSLVTIFIWWRYLREESEKNDQPALNQRARQYIGRVVTLESAIENGRGRVKIADTIWRVAGKDLPAGAKVKVIDVDGVILFVEPV